MNANQERHHVVVILCVMTLISNVASNVYEDMQGKRAWPEVRGTLATKRSAPDIFGILDDSTHKKKSALEDIKNKVLEKLQREIREAHANYMNQVESQADFKLEGDGKEDASRLFPANNQVQFPAKNGEFQTNRLIHWPGNLRYQMQHPSYQHRLGEQGDVVNQRINFQVGKDFPVDKRKPFDVDWDVTRGDLSLKRAKRSKTRGNDSPDM